MERIISLSGPHKGPGFVIGEDQEMTFVSGASVIKPTEEEIEAAKRKCEEWGELLDSLEDLD